MNEAETAQNDYHSPNNYYRSQYPAEVQGKLFRSLIFSSEKPSPVARCLIGSHTAVSLSIDDQALEQPVQRGGVFQFPYLGQHPIAPRGAQRAGSQAPELLLDLP